MFERWPFLARAFVLRASLGFVPELCTMSQKRLRDDGVMKVVVVEI